MKMKLSFMAIVLGVGALAGFTACSPDYETDFTRSVLEVPHSSQATIVFPLAGGQHEIKVESNLPVSDWTATANADWCEVTKADGTVNVSAGAYDGYTQRQAVVTVAYGHQSYDIAVIQMGKEANLDILEEGGFFKRKTGMFGYISGSATECMVPMLTNLEVDHVQIPDTCNWVHYTPQTLTADENNRTNLKLDVDQNTTNQRRYCTVILQSSMNYDLPCQFVIVQEKVGYTVVPLYSKDEYTVEDGGEKLFIPFVEEIPSNGYTAEVSADAQEWLTLETSGTTVSGGELAVVVAPNEVQSPRTGTITLTSKNSGGKQMVLTVNQKQFVPVPPFNVVDLKTTAGNGNITVSWQKPEKVNYAKVVVTCHNAKLNTTVTKTITNKDQLSVVFENTYQFAGEYEFTVKTYGLTGLETNEPKTITGVSLPWSEKVEFNLTAGMITSNAVQTDDGGGIPALVDKNVNTYFHSLWSSNSDDNKPHRLQFALGRTIARTFYFDYDGRNGGNGNGDIKSVNIYGSQSGVPNDAAWELLGTIDYDLPAGRGQRATAKSQITTTKDYEFLRFIPTARRDRVFSNDGSSSNWWNMSELHLYEVHDEAWKQAHM